MNDRMVFTCTFGDQPQVGHGDAGTGHTGEVAFVCQGVGLGEELIDGV